VFLFHQNEWGNKNAENYEFLFGNIIRNRNITSVEKSEKKYGMEIKARLKPKKKETVRFKNTDQK